MTAGNALWQWDGGAPWPKPTAFPGMLSGKETGPAYQPTKTGLLAADVIAFTPVPLIANGSPIPALLIQQWIRYVEDKLEQDTGIRLCQTWISASAQKTALGAQAFQLKPLGGAGQVLGVDYDLGEPGYDFYVDRGLDDGWMVQKLRWKPLKGPLATSQNGVQSYIFTYPLLNSYEQIPISWIVEDPDYGLVRLVPSANIQFLPIIQLQFALLGFSRSLPAGLQIQYVAGLSPSDYASDYSFVLQLVLAKVSNIAMGVAQGWVNLGIQGLTTSVDGLMQKLNYSANGPYAPFIAENATMIKDCFKTLRTKVGGFTFNII